MDWFNYSIINIAHYLLVEQRLRPWSRALRRWATTRRAQVRVRLAAWRVSWSRHKERRPMPTTIQEEALYRATAAQISGDFLDWLKAQHYAAFQADATEQAAATARARADLEAEYATRAEAQADALAAYKAQVQADADTELEAAVARERRRVRDEFAESLEEARAEQAEALQRAAETDAQLLGLWQQLLPEGRQVYLHDAGILELDLVTVQPLLQRQGWALAFQKSEGSARLVKVKVSATAWQAATRFWLEAAPPEAAPPLQQKPEMIWS